MSRDKGWFKGGLSTGFNRYRHRVGIGASLILGLIFIASGVGKIFDPNDFLAMLLRTSLIPYDLSVLISVALPWVELLLGISLIMGIAVRFMSGVSFLLIIGFILQNAWLIKQGIVTEDCGCFGGLADLLESEKQIIFSSWTALYIDIGMLALSLLILFCYTGKLFATVPWHLTRHRSPQVTRNNG